MDLKKRFLITAAILCLALSLAGCSPANKAETLAAPAQPVTTNPPAAVIPPTSTNPSLARTKPAPTNAPPAAPTSTKLNPSEFPTNPPQVATATPDQAEISALFPLSEPGPYFPGNTSIKFTDTSRGDREIRLTIWYPALKLKDAQGRVIRRDVAPDMSHAPYPLILTAPNSGDMLFLSHLSTYGFVTVIVRFADFEYSDYLNFGIVDHPLDMLFGLDQLATNPPAVLAGVLDTENVGVAGYSWDGFFSLALSGVRIDPEFYLSWCREAPNRQPPYKEWYLEYTCGLAAQWDAFEQHVGKQYTAGEDGLWLPVTDPRIRAVMPMAVDGAWLYGKRGLAAVNRPVLMIQASEDSDYQPAEAAFIFEHLGSPDKSMISFIGQEHMMISQPEQVNQINHFTVAFFGYHLLGLEEYKGYFSEDFVSQSEDLAWGIYTK